MALPTINYTKEGDNVNHGMDSIAVRNYIAGFEGGRALDVTDWSENTIPVLTPIITNDNGSYKPLAAGAGGFSLPSGYHYCGLAAASVKKSLPACPIIYAGVVNAEVLPSKDKDWSAIKTALPHLMFMKDEA